MGLWNDKRIQNSKHFSPTVLFIEELRDTLLANSFKTRGIEIHSTFQRKIMGNLLIFGVSESAVIVVKVFEELEIDELKIFVALMADIRSDLHVYSNYNILGAVAFLQDQDQSAKYAEKQKLFVIKATGDSASIINESDFQPRIF